MNVVTACGELITEMKHNLPEEIIIEILTRLPVKSLIRYRLVSKSWNSLIIDPSFIKKHLNQAQQQRAILCSSSSSELFSCSLSSLSNPAGNDQFENIHPLETRNNCRVMFLGNCNGLFCICIAAKLFLWNPSTRKSRKLPSPGIPIPINIHNVSSSFAVSAFGYDSGKNDYKVVRIVWLGSSKFGTLLYSLKKDSWSIIQDHSPYRIDNQTAGIFVNGAFHWLVNHSIYSEESYAIVSFDLTNERYGTLPLPHESFAARSVDKKFHIGVLKGWLCLYCNYFRNHFMLWAMMDYGVENSWTQMLKFEYDNVFGSIYVHIVPKYMFNNGELLLEAKVSSDRVEVVRCKENEVPVRVCDGISDIGEIHVFAETVISPYVMEEF